MSRGLKNGSNITSRSRLFAGQSEEANHPVPEARIGNKTGQNEQFRSRSNLNKRLTDCIQY